jgi:hypothetical protein
MVVAEAEKEHDLEEHLKVNLAGCGLSVDLQEGRGRKSTWGVVRRTGEH